MMASPLAPKAILMLLSSLLVRHKASMGIFREGKPCPGFLSAGGKYTELDWPCASSCNYKASAFSSLLPPSLFCMENNKLSAEYCEC